MTGPNPWPSVAVISLMGVPCSLDPPASASLLLGLQLCHHSRLCWELNSGQCACQAMTLPIELPPSFKRIFKRKLIVIPCTDSLLKKKLHLFYMRFCVHQEFSGQISGTGSVFPLCGTQGLNPRHQAWQQAPSASESL